MKTPVVFHGVSVPANSIYGTIKAENYNFVFVSMPKMDSFNKMPFVFYQNGRIVKNIYSAMLESAISQSVKSLANDGKITLTYWNHKAEQKAEMRIVERENKRKSERKEWQEIRSAQKNRDSAGHKPSKHTKAMRAKPNFYTAEYNNAFVSIINRVKYKCCKRSFRITFWCRNFLYNLFKNGFNVDTILC